MFSSISVSSARGRSALIVGHFQGKGLDKQTANLDKDGSIADAAKRKEATGDLGKIVECFPGGKDAPTRVLLVGLGPADSFDTDALRTAAAAAARRLAGAKEPAATIDLSGPIADLDPARAGQAFGEGIGLVGWVCDKFKGKGSKTEDRPSLSLRAADSAFAKGLKRGLGLAESTNIARTLSQTPPNICTPYWIAEEARKMARKAGLKCTIIKGEALEKERLAGLINVGKASEHKPCLIRLEYTPGGSGGGAKKKPIVLIGKTLCYDSGGLSLKINNSMKGMKRDKDGGCAVFGAMHAIATVIKPKRPVVALLVAAENAISETAYRPDDILTFRNGVTVEVTNTDAEGRLVLADGLCWACDKENPEAIIDMATLTGGVVVALGKVFAGLWCDDDDLRGRIECAAAGTGERLWRLPHHQEYRDMMKSPVADIVNSAPVREAHPIQGAAFLSHFVNGVPWAHIDIAGVHAVDKDTGPYIPGPTGWGVRLLAELAGA